MSADWCPGCDGNQTVDICPTYCNGGHVEDHPVSCPTCGGLGRLPQQPSVEPDGWCEECQQAVWRRSDGTLMGHPCVPDAATSAPSPTVTKGDSEAGSS